MAYHVAFVTRDILNRILKGEKKVESRLTKNSSHPAQRVVGNDTIFFKVIGGTIEARAKVYRIDCFWNLNPEKIAAIAQLYSPPMGITVDDKWWQLKKDSKTAVLLWLEYPTCCTLPREAIPTGIRSGWLANYLWGALATNCRADRPPAE